MGSVSVTPQQLTPGSRLNTQMTWYISPAQFYLQPKAAAEGPISVVEADMSQVVEELCGDANTAFAHCISGDFGEERQMSAGVATVFRDHFEKPSASDRIGSRLTCQRVEGGATVYGLVTKPVYNAKPTVESYDAAFEELVEAFKSRGLKRLVCSPMGCVRDQIPIKRFAANLTTFQEETGAQVKVVVRDEHHRRHLLRNGLTYQEFLGRLRHSLNTLRPRSNVNISPLVTVER